MDISRFTYDYVSWTHGHMLTVDDEQSLVQGVEYLGLEAVIVLPDRLSLPELHIFNEETRNAQADSSISTFFR